MAGSEDIGTKAEKPQSVAASAAIREERKSQGGTLRRVFDALSATDWMNRRVKESLLPTEEGLGYKSTVGFYGGTLVEDGDGRLVFDTRGLLSKFDQWGDRILRTYDEHYAKEPAKMLGRHPRFFLQLLPFFSDAKRYRGTAADIIANAKRLGLEEYYGLHPWGVELKRPEVFSHAIPLQDIFRQDQINHPAVNAIDRFQALGVAAAYMRQLHDAVGGIAEGNTCQFIFTKHDGSAVANPILMIPTEIYNPAKHISAIEQKTTDFLDLLASVAIEEYRRSESWESVRKALRIALLYYHDKDVIAMTSSYVKRGRLTIPGDAEALLSEPLRKGKAKRYFFSRHNRARLSAYDEGITGGVRREIAAACDAYFWNKRPRRRRVPRATLVP